jgi:hypothetical protein
MRKFILKPVLFFVFAILQHVALAQDTSRLRVSLLTCSPGDELYSTFGHSALRIIDSTATDNYRDVVYNYGTFDFGQEGFYIKFIRGKLLYNLSLATFEDFRAEYDFDQREIIEQVLNFTGVEKINIRKAILENAKE